MHVSCVLHCRPGSLAVGSPWGKLGSGGGAQYPWGATPGPNEPLSDTGLGWYTEGPDPSSGDATHSRQYTCAHRTETMPHNSASPCPRAGGSHLPSPTWSFHLLARSRNYCPRILSQVFLFLPWAVVQLWPPVM